MPSFSGVSLLLCMLVDCVRPLAIGKFICLFITSNATIGWNPLYCGIILHCDKRDLARALDGSITGVQTKWLKSSLLIPQHYWIVCVSCPYRVQIKEKKYVKNYSVSAQNKLDSRCCNFLFYRFRNIHWTDMVPFQTQEKD